jgi:hypothetical protein
MVMQGPGYSGDGNVQPFGDLLDGGGINHRTGVLKGVQLMGQV